MATTPQTNSQIPDLDKMNVDEIESILKKKKDQQRKEREKMKAQYEKDREELIGDLIQDAIGINMMMQALKSKAMQKLPEFRQKMLDYGSLRNGKGNKGTFEIKTELFKITFTHHELKAFDERAELAESKLKKFLETFVKKRNKDVYTLVQSLLERTKSGDYDISLINRLYQLEEQFDNEDWRDAIRLFKESFSPTGTAQYVRFWKKDSTGTWQPVVLDFAKLKTDTHETVKKEATKA